MKAWILALVLVTGCSEKHQDEHWPRQQYELETGEVVSCRWSEETGCGLNLWDCEDGQRYNCQTNVQRL